VHSLLAITRALSDENRVRALLSLGDQEICVCQLIELLHLAPSTVSKHLLILKQAGLAVGQKKGRWMYYRLPGRAAAPMVRHALLWVRRAINEDPRIQKDALRMKKIMGTDRQALCERQSSRRRRRATS